MTDLEFEEEKENLEIQNLKYWSNYYATENQRLEADLKRFGITKSDLTKDGQFYLNELVRMAQKLHLDNCSFNDTAYMTAISDIIKEKYDNELKKVTLDHELNEWIEKLLELNLINENLVKDYGYIEENLSSLKEEIREKKFSIENFMSSKLNKYRSDLELYESHNILIDPSLKHDVLCKEYDELKFMEKEIDGMKGKLNSYHNLPPNITMAKLKLQELKDEIRNVDREIEACMHRDLGFANF